MSEAAIALIRKQHPDIEVFPLFIETENALRQALDQARQGGAAMLDFETTGLDPETAEVRLAQVAVYDQDTGDILSWWVVDFWALPAGDFASYADWFADISWIAFNAQFEYSWFARLDLVKVQVHDVAHVRRAVMGGDQMSFAMMLKVDLKVDLPKDEQKSNWADPELRPEQLAYAALDAYWTAKLDYHWACQAAERDAAGADVWRCVMLFDDMVPVCSEMTGTGLLLDADRHQELVATWQRKQQQYIDQIRELLPESDVANLNSQKQHSDFWNRILPDDWLDAWPATEKTGKLSTSKDAWLGMAVHARSSGADELAHLWQCLGEKVTVDQYLRNFGDKLITMAANASDGRLHPSYNIARARTCRLSSSKPNAQQFPRDRELLGEFTSVRRSFIAPPGKLLVSLDYSGIELRVLALLSDDEVLLHDCVHGDIHLEVAQLRARRKLDKSVPADYELRSRAKGVSFGIIYGSGAGGLATTMQSSLTEAQDMLEMWAGRYKKAFELRNDVMAEATDNEGYIQMVDGGTIWMGKRPDLPKCANYPVQRAALSIMARAMHRHRVSLDKAFDRGEQRRTRMAATIHDALIDETAEADAVECCRIMKKDMIDGYLDIFPGAPTDRLVEGGWGPSWGELEEHNV